MKHVRKDAPPTDFDAWKAQANEDWTPTYNDLRDPEKRNLHSALLAEQGSVCCYCGRSISLEDSHIEHFRPQEQYAGLQLEYANLHASCMRGLRRSMPRHCGHAKENGFDEEQHIAPADPDCERRFMYTLRGEIVPADSEDERAKYMIGLLALEAPTLRHLREEVLSQTLDPSFLATATQQELEQLCDSFRRRDATGKLPGFGHVIARYAEQNMARTANSPDDDVTQHAGLIESD
ncbi:MAG: retron system putative HNH endonuclease [Trinickia sp.]|jgi:uncharacterized protein (TIGR02646 family)|uniref:retron system putative HNH endonuclease n=1 Tax=Trinickia sp. TaxID=2571163 RepID=UPI003F7F3490